MEEMIKSSVIILVYTLVIFLFYFAIVSILPRIAKKRVITRANSPYLIRYTLIKTKWFSLKIHKIIQSDPEDLHDHPWSFISLILWGGYTEERILNPTDYASKWKYKFKFYSPLSLLIRKRPSIHRLILPKDKNGKPRPCFTLVLTLRRKSSWGFWKSDQWVEHHLYNPEKTES